MGGVLILGGDPPWSNGAACCGTHLSPG